MKVRRFAEHAPPNGSVFGLSCLLATLTRSKQVVAVTGSPCSGCAALRSFVIWTLSSCRGCQVLPLFSNQIGMPGRPGAAAEVCKGMGWAPHEGALPGGGRDGLGGLGAPCSAVPGSSPLPRAPHRACHFLVPHKACRHCAVLAFLDAPFECAPYQSRVLGAPPPASLLTTYRVSHPELGFRGACLCFGHSVAVKLNTSLVAPATWEKLFLQVPIEVLGV